MTSEGQHGQPAEATSGDGFPPDTDGRRSPDDFPNSYGPPPQATPNGGSPFVVPAVPPFGQAGPGDRYGAQQGGPSTGSARVPQGSARVPQPSDDGAPSSRRPSATDLFRGAATGDSAPPSAWAPPPPASPSAEASPFAPHPYQGSPDQQRDYDGFAPGSPTRGRVDQDPSAAGPAWGAGFGPESGPDARRSEGQGAESSGPESRGPDSLGGEPRPAGPGGRPPGLSAFGDQRVRVPGATLTDLPDAPPVDASAGFGEPSPASRLSGPGGLPPRSSQPEIVDRTGESGALPRRVASEDPTGFGAPSRSSDALFPRRPETDAGPVRRTTDLPVRGSRSATGDSAAFGAPPTPGDSLFGAQPGPPFGDQPDRPAAFGGSPAMRPEQPSYSDPGSRPGQPMPFGEPGAGRPERGAPGDGQQPPAFGSPAAAQSSPAFGDPGQDRRGVAYGSPAQPRSDNLRAIYGPPAQGAEQPENGRGAAGPTSGQPGDPTYGRRPAGPEGSAPPPYAANEAPGEGAYGRPSPNGESPYGRGDGEPRFGGHSPADDESPYGNTAPSGPDPFGRPAPGAPDPFGRPAADAPDPFGRPAADAPDPFGRPAGDGPGQFGRPAADGPGQFGPPPAGTDQFGRPVSGDGQFGSPAAGPDQFGRPTPDDRDQFGRPVSGGQFNRSPSDDGDQFNRSPSDDGDQFNRSSSDDGDQFGRPVPHDGGQFGRPGPDDRDQFGRPVSGGQFGRPVPGEESPFAQPAPGSGESPFARPAPGDGQPGGSYGRPAAAADDSPYGSFPRPPADENEADTAGPASASGYKQRVPGASFADNGPPGSPPPPDSRHGAGPAAVDQADTGGAAKGTARPVSASASVPMASRVGPVEGEDVPPPAQAPQARVYGRPAQPDSEGPAPVSPFALPGADGKGPDRPAADRSPSSRPGPDRSGPERPGADRPGADWAGANRPGADRFGDDPIGGVSQDLPPLGPKTPPPGGRQGPVRASASARVAPPSPPEQEAPTYNEFTDDMAGRGPLTPPGRTPDSYGENTTDMAGRGPGPDQPYVPAPALPSLHARPPLVDGFPAPANPEEQQSGISPDRPRLGGVFPGPGSQSRATVTPPGPDETASWPGPGGAGAESDRFEQFKPETEAPPKPETPHVRMLPVLLGVILGAALLVGVSIGVVWLIARGSDTGFSASVGDCVKRSGDEAVKATCGEPDTFSVVSKVDTKEQCPDPGQPYVLNPSSDGKSQVLCLKPSS